MKKIFVVDWILLLMFVLSLYSGVELHVAGHESDHAVWHNWAVFHVLTSFSFLVATLFHVATHWGWYRGFMRTGLGRKSRVTLLLSFLFLFVSVTGVVLLGVSGAHSGMGRWHYGVGLVMAVFSIGHILKRLPLLRKSLLKR